MPISRLVADNSRRSPSALNRICDRMGSVLRLETAWLTVASARLSSDCLHVICIKILLSFIPVLLARMSLLEIRGYAGSCEAGVSLQRVAVFPGSAVSGRSPGELLA